MEAEIWATTPENVSVIRLSAFIGMLVLIGLLERLMPRRKRMISTPYRWANNLVLVFVNSAVMRLVFPVTLIWFAEYASGQGWGLVNVIGLPYWAGFVIALILLDLGIYFQHRLFHAVPVLWRLHRLHHTDLDYDLTTGLRFHPVEILISMAIKFALVALLGAPAFAVLVFEILLSSLAIFNHANMKIPVKLDSVLRLFLVTPDVHRTHHSTVKNETDSNFGFSITTWDFLFGTYIAQPKAGHEGMTIGLDQFREKRDLRLDRMLWQPLRSQSTSAESKTDQVKDRVS